MEVRDESGNVLGDDSAFEYDPAKQMLDQKTETVHHDANPYIAPKGHYEVIAEYPETGGQDVEFIEEEPGQDFKPEWDETVTYLVLRDLTEDELAARMVWEEQAKAEQERQETLSLLPDALADLSETVSTNEVTGTELADAIAELSAIVSELASSTESTE